MTDTKKLIDSLSSNKSYITFAKVARNLSELYYLKNDTRDPNALLRNVISLLTCVEANEPTENQKEKAKSIIEYIGEWRESLTDEDFNELKIDDYNQLAEDIFLEFELPYMPKEILEDEDQTEEEEEEEEAEEEEKDEDEGRDEYLKIIEVLNKTYREEDFHQAALGCLELESLSKNFIDDYPDSAAFDEVESLYEAGLDFAQPYREAGKVPTLKEIKKCMEHIADQSGAQLLDYNFFEGEEVEVEVEEEEEEEIEEESSRRPMKQVFQDVGAGLLEGGALTLADQFNELAVDALTLSLDEIGLVPKEFMQNEGARRVGKIVAPTALMVASNSLRDSIPGSDIIYSGAQKALAVSSFQWLTPLLSKMRPKFEKLEKAAREVEISTKELPESEKPISDPLHEILKKEKCDRI